MKFIYFLAYRIFAAVFVRTFYNPDEFFQSMEVAHRMAFGYGAITWEWKEGLRSFLYPLIISFVYWILEALGLDQPYNLILAPRLMQGTLQAIGEYCFVKFIRKNFGNRIANMTTFFLMVNFFNFHIGVRTLTNSIEMSLLLIVLYLYPFSFEKGRSYWQYMIVAALAFCIRCTCIVIFIPLGVSHLVRDWTNFWKSFRIAIGPSLLLLAASTAVDSYFCERFVFNPYHFFMFNVYNQGSTIFGVEKFTYYLTSVIPDQLHILTLPFVLQWFSMFRRKKDGQLEILWQIAGTYVFSLFVTSLNPHKEERFILPLLPLSIFMASVTVVQWEEWLIKNRSKVARFLIIWFCTTCFLSDSMLIIKKSRFDGRGRIDVTLRLAESLDEDRRIQGRTPSILFLGECYGYPLASGIHRPIPTRYVSCADQGYYLEKAPFWLHSYIQKMGKASDDITHLYFCHSAHLHTTEPLLNWLDFTEDVIFEQNMITNYKDSRASDTVAIRRDFSRRTEWLATRKLPPAEAAEE
ncbi:GPI mannosyltransferase 3-like isoform X2 [Artemia franciscana]|uniref:Mannosyltransferase n=1 Tax=Artemia franciscana TaxID=6661 RepID=A0AA88LFR8_ARTSF|nr:hypothetical protein QYM36_001493 [Artemia franciscana]